MAWSPKSNVGKCRHSIWVSTTTHNPIPQPPPPSMTHTQCCCTAALTSDHDHRYINQVSARAHSPLPLAFTRTGHGPSNNNDQWPATNDRPSPCHSPTATSPSLTNCSNPTMMTWAQCHCHVTEDDHPVPSPSAQHPSPRQWR